MIKIVVVENNETIREGLKTLINQSKDYRCIAAYSSCQEIIKNIEKLEPNIVLVDIQLSQVSAIEGIKEIKRKQPDVIILILTAYEENDIIFDALCAGASGYVVKKTPPEKFLEFIQEACDSSVPMSSQIARKVNEFFKEKKQSSLGLGNNTLTKREKEILAGLIEGSSFKVIADSLFTNIEAIKLHSRNIYKKLHSVSKAEALKFE